MKLVQMDLWAANAYIEQHHRHLAAKRHHRFSLGAEHGGKLVGVAIVDFRVGTAKYNRIHVEVSRVCTNGTPNACSFLLSACARAAKALGYRRIYTYTLPEEGGASLRASGWTHDGQTKGKSGWATANFNATETPDLSQRNILQGVKDRWVRVLSDDEDVIPYPASFPNPRPTTIHYWRHQEWLRKQGKPYAKPQNPMHERKLQLARKGED